MTMITIIKVKPDMRQEWLDVEKNEVIPAYKKAGVPSVTVVTTALFGDSDEFTIITPVQKFAGFDDPNPLVAALKPEGATRLVNKLRKMSISTRRILLLNRPDLTIPPSMTAPPKYAIVTHINVKPGGTQEVEAWLKNDILANVKKGGSKGYLVSQTIYGGSLTEYHTVVFRDSFADFDKPSEMIKAVGQAGLDKVLAKAGMIDHVERYVSRVIPELSYAPAP